MCKTRKMIKVLFICHGNICRSPMAEFLFKDIVRNENLEKDIYVESAATSTEEIGNGIYPKAREQLASHNISGYKDKTARQVIKSDYEEFDYLIIMDEENRHGLKRIVGDDSDSKIFKLLDFVDDENYKGKDVDDPWYTREFGRCFDEIKKGCEAFLSYLKENM